MGLDAAEIARLRAEHRVDLSARDDDELDNVHALCDELGITYRQLDYWHVRGFITGEAGRRHGSGFARAYTATELARLRRIAELVHAGMKPAAAACVADQPPTTDALTLAWAAGRGECA